MLFFYAVKFILVKNERVLHNSSKILTKNRNYLIHEWINKLIELVNEIDKALFTKTFKVFMYKMQKS